MQLSFYLGSNLNSFHNKAEAKQSDAQNFYLLKIHLNLFEISDRVLKFENLIKICKSFIPTENLF